MRTVMALQLINASVILEARETMNHRMPTIVGGGTNVPGARIDHSAAVTDGKTQPPPGWGRRQPLKTGSRYIAAGAADRVMKSVQVRTDFSSALRSAVDVSASATAAGLTSSRARDRRIVESNRSGAPYMFSRTAHNDTDRLGRRSPPCDGGAAAVGAAATAVDDSQERDGASSLSSCHSDDLTLDGACGGSASGTSTGAEVTLGQLRKAADRVAIGRRGRPPND
jgi:hypothetical protein